MHLFYYLKKKKFDTLIYFKKSIDYISHIGYIGNFIFSLYDLIHKGSLDILFQQLLN